MAGRSQRLTRLELEVMEHVWGRGEVSVREICDAIPLQRRPAYTTILTIIQRLEAKAAVRRTRRVGNAHLYESIITRRSALQRVADEFIALFGGAQPLVAHLVETGRLTLADVRAIEEATGAIAPATDRIGGGEAEEVRNHD